MPQPASSFDVAIVGARLAGAATGAFLAGRGLRVAIVDRAVFPRDKPCGEGVLPHGVDVLGELGLLDRVYAAGAREITGVRYTLHDGQTVAAALPRLPGRSHIALGIRRLALDAVLLDHARSSGDVTVCEGFRVRALLRSGSAVTGVTDGERAIHARVVVGADGIRSTVRRLLGWDTPHHWPNRYAVVGHLRMPYGRELPPEVEVILDRGMEAYVTPLGGGEALVALLGGRSLMRRFAGDLAGTYAGILGSHPRLRLLFAGAELLPGVRATGPFAVRARRVAGPGVALVGDAAGFLDPITGEGMAAALLQARAAAGIIEAELCRDGMPDLRPFAREHRRITATGTRLTWIALALCASPALSRRALAGLQHNPDLLPKLLAANCGYAGLRSIRPREWLAMLSGW